MFDINNNYTGTMLGTDRHGFTTPDLDASEFLRPFLPISYPAPWLPIRRRDEGHPIGAGVVMSTGYAVGVDKNGALIPAGTLSGTTAASAFGDTSGYCLVQYGADDIGFSLNPQTGNYVAATGEYVLLAAPSNAANGTVVDGVAVTAGDITFAKACTLVPGGRARAIGYLLGNAYQFLGGTTVSSTTGGVTYTMDSNVPLKWRTHNYMHAMGSAIQTEMVLRMPWIGATPSTLATLASGDGVTGYVQSDFSKSFTHITGSTSLALDLGGFAVGASVVASSVFSGKDAGHYGVFNSAVHGYSDICGKIIGVENMNPIREFKDRVRTQFDRAETFVGPFADKNPSTFMMGGSATRGMDYQINLSTNGLFRKYIDQGLTPRNELSTYALVHFRA